MNIKILDSWLREYLETKASVHDIAEKISLSSVSVERIEPFEKDHVYDIEITTNRPDLMSVIGLAREVGAVLPAAGIEAEFAEQKLGKIKKGPKLALEIVSNPKLVNRICAVALEVKLGPSLKDISERLETSDIRSINNVIDVTNYVMREIGHPMHAFDYDKLLETGKMIIRESKKGEIVKTLDGKEYALAGGDIIADNGKGEIIDLLGIMGTENSSVTDSTTRVILFIDNDDPIRIRKTSMSLGIRTEAAVLNEKSVDPEATMDAILRGIELLKKNAYGKVISEILDIYPNKPMPKTVTVTQEQINSVIGIDIPIKTATTILENLGFEISTRNTELFAKIPSWRANDIFIPEDLIEEVARVYGYYKLPNVLPSSTDVIPYNQNKDPFYWESKTRNALKYLGFTEIYTYPMVSENMLEGNPSDSITIKNPLTEDHTYMRRTLVPSLLESVRDNKNREEIKLFELANVYLKRPKNLPEEKLRLAGVYRKEKADFLEVKGTIEALLADLGINDVEFRSTKSGGVGAGVYIGKDYLGEIELLEQDLIDFELEFETILKYATLHKIYKPVSKFPEAVEDLRFEIDETIAFDKIVKAINEQSDLIKRVELLDVYKTKKTFRVIYQSSEKNLTAEDLSSVREKIVSALKKNFKAEPA